MKFKRQSSASYVGKVHDDCETECAFFFGGGGGLTIVEDLKLSELCPSTKGVRFSFNIDFASRKYCPFPQDTNIRFDVDLGFAPFTKELVQSS